MDVASIKVVEINLEPVNDEKVTCSS